MKIIYIESPWTTKDTIQHPDCLYIFNDYFQKREKDAIAEIRNQTNAVGIPTKKFESNAIDAYFNDYEHEYNKRMFDIVFEKILKIARSGIYSCIVFPKEMFEIQNAIITNYSFQQKLQNLVHDLSRM
jgi:hypothetical protein